MSIDMATESARNEELRSLVLQFGAELNAALSVTPEERDMLGQIGMSPAQKAQAKRKET